MQDRGFTRTGVPDNTDLFSPPDFKIQIIEQYIVSVVPETDMLEFQFMIEVDCFNFFIRNFTNSIFFDLVNSPFCSERSKFCFTIFNLGICNFPLFHSFAFRYFFLE